MKAPKRKSGFFNFFCKLVATSVVFYFLFTIFSQFNKVRLKKSILDDLNCEIKLYESKRSRLSSALCVKDSELERSARERGFSKENERVFVISSK